MSVGRGGQLVERGRRHVAAVAAQRAGVATRHLLVGGGQQGPGQRQHRLGRLGQAAGNAILRASHADDPVLAQFGRLAGSGFPVAKKLAKDKDVEDEEIYGLGFRLLESSDGNDQELGAELLAGIVEDRPRSKLAKAAKNKLKLTGHLDD